MMACGWTPRPSEIICHQVYEVEVVLSSLEIDVLQCPLTSREGSSQQILLVRKMKSYSCKEREKITSLVRI
jgi:hypothetical protein